MTRTLLIGTHEFSWREWVKRELRGRDLLVLDPNEPNQNALARVCLVREGKVVAYRFVGSLDPLRNPLAVLQATTQLLAKANENVVIQCFDYRPQPVARHLALIIAQLIGPAEILVPTGADIPMDGWPVGPHAVDAESGFPPMVLAAQRRARWLEMIEDSQEHSIPWDQVSIMGARFGSGVRVHPYDLEKEGIPGVLWAERCGTTLFLISKRNLDDRQLTTALNVGRATHVIVVDPMQYSGRLCSLARQNGEDFGMGFIEELDFVHGVFRVHAVAIPPAPVRILKLGTLTIDSTGREIEDEKPWSS